MPVLFNCERLRGLRLQWGISQQQLADELDVDVKTVRNYERGRVNSPFFTEGRSGSHQIVISMLQYFGLEDKSDLLMEVSSEQLSVWDLLSDEDQQERPARCSANASSASSTNLPQVPLSGGLPSPNIPMTPWASTT